MFTGRGKNEKTLLLVLTALLALALLPGNALALFEYSAELNQNMIARSGPGAQYTWEGFYDMCIEIKLFEKTPGSNSFGMVELVEKNGDRKRLYTEMDRIYTMGSQIPVQNTTVYQAVTVCGTYAYYGPGYDYAQRAEYVPAGQKLSVFINESGFVLCDYSIAGTNGLIRAYLPASCVSTAGAQSAPQAGDMLTLSLDGAGKARVEYTRQAGVNGCSMSYFILDSNNQIVDYAEITGTVWYPSVTVSGRYLARVIITDAYGRLSSLESEWTDMTFQTGALPGLRPATAGYPGATLPSYQEGRFTDNYAVYLGPGTNYLRPANGRALLGSGGVCRIYGWDGKWLLVGYENSTGDYRIGYIANYRLPSNISSVERVSYARAKTTTVRAVDVTDDPISNLKPLETLPVNTQVTFMAWLSAKRGYAMIEYYSSVYGQKVRAFVPGDALALTGSAANAPQVPNAATVRPVTGGTAFALVDLPVLTVTETVFCIQTTAAYTGPDPSCYRSKSGDASVYQGDFVDVFGQIGDYLLVRFPSLLNGTNVTGTSYAPANCFDGTQHAALTLDARAILIDANAVLIDDPDVQRSGYNTISINRSSAKALAVYYDAQGNEWVYFEAWGQPANGTGYQPVRGFVLSSGVTLR